MFFAVDGVMEFCYNAVTVSQPIREHIREHKVTADGYKLCLKSRPLSRVKS